MTTESSSKFGLGLVLGVAVAVVINVGVAFLDSRCAARPPEAPVCELRIELAFEPAAEAEALMEQFSAAVREIRPNGAVMSCEVAGR